MNHGCKLHEFKTDSSFVWVRRHSFDNSLFSLSDSFRIIYFKEISLYIALWPFKMSQLFRCQYENITININEHSVHDEFQSIKVHQVSYDCHVI